MIVLIFQLPNFLGLFLKQIETLAHTVSDLRHILHLMKDFRGQEVLYKNAIVES